MPIDTRFRGKIETNKLCGKLGGATNDRRVYVVMCEDEIDAEYLTIQIMATNAKLELNEVEIITIDEGKVFLHWYTEAI